MSLGTGGRLIFLLRLLRLSFLLSFAASFAEKAKIQINAALDTIRSWIGHGKCFVAIVWYVSVTSSHHISLRLRRLQGKDFCGEFGKNIQSKMQLEEEKDPRLKVRRRC